MEKRYMISDAAKLVDVEAHVLRYWEDELQIQIPRNEMGHRFYTDYLISLFREIKDLKEQGFLLKAIKMLLPEISDGKSVTPLDVKNVTDISVHVADTTELKQANAPSDKMEQFQLILGSIVSKALEENNSSLGQAVSSQVSESVIKQMDYLLRLKEEHEEERFKRLDETIRNYQKSKKEIAAASDKRKHRFFTKKV